MVFVADDLGAWLVGLFADAGRKKLITFVLGTDQERALRTAAMAAVLRTAEELCPDDDDQAEHVALVISQVFSEPIPAVLPAGHETLLEGLQAGIAGQLAVLDDGSLTGTEQSSANLLGFPAGTLAQKLTGHLMREIVSRGARGGPLFPLASQLNDDVTHLQSDRIEEMLGQLTDEVRKALTRLENAPTGEQQIEVRPQAAKRKGRVSMFDERLAAASAQLGHSVDIVRIAGVHAMAQLADDSKKNRQACVDVLCAYLRKPYKLNPQVAKSNEFAASRNARHEIIKVVTAHLRRDAAISWRGLNFDFTGTVFDGGDFSGAVFSDGTVSLRGAKFANGAVSFRSAVFSGMVDLADAVFSGGFVSFVGARFSGGIVSFVGAEFAGSVVDFAGADFTGGIVSFAGAQFSSGIVSFVRARFIDGVVDFAGSGQHGVAIDEWIDFKSPRARSTLSRESAQFSGSTVLFEDACFSGTAVSFAGVSFSGGEVDFSQVCDWSVPPILPWSGKPPRGVKVPAGYEP